MGVRKIPRAVFEPIEEVSCEELLTIQHLHDMVLKETPLAIKEALRTKKDTATLFEISGLDYYLNIPRLYWVSALQRCSDVLSVEEKFEECISIQKLIEEVQKPTQLQTKKQTKNVEDGTAPE